MAKRSDSDTRRLTQRVLTIDPRIRRLCAAYFEGAVLVEATIRNIRKDPPEVRVRKRLIPALIRMLDRYEPTVLLVPDIGPNGVRRSVNVREMIQAVVREAGRRELEVIAVSEQQVRAAFNLARRGSGKNKHTINEVLLEWFPELEAGQPKMRRVWDAEHHAQPLFDAIARWCAWQGLPTCEVRASVEK